MRDKRLALRDLKVLGTGKVGSEVRNINSRPALMGPNRRDRASAGLLVY
jgi:hypothetical protein